VERRRVEADIKVGCCGFGVSQKEYHKLFTLIEVQNTFYQLPRLETAKKWRGTAPQDFEFTMKAWQLITHKPSSPTYRRLRNTVKPANFNRYGSFRATQEVVEAWNHTAMFARTLGVSIVVFQCPASFRPTKQNAANMREFFSRIDRADFRLVWEPRGLWPHELIIQLCEELQLIHCVDPFKNKPLYGDFHYFRLHGITGYAYRYTDADLLRLRKWVGKKPTYLLFNNNWMKDDALRFMKFVETGACPRNEN
jgi:uncharacterized protein YecE (DUF72 family)